MIKKGGVHLFAQYGCTETISANVLNKLRCTIDNPNKKSKPTRAAEHFLSSPNHTANDMQLIPIEKIFSNRDSIRKAREAFLRWLPRVIVKHPPYRARVRKGNVVNSS